MHSLIFAEAFIYRSVAPTRLSSETILEFVDDFFDDSKRENVKKRFLYNKENIVP